MQEKTMSRNKQEEPSKKTLLWCMDLATTTEAAWHLYDKVSERIGKKHAELCQKFYDFADEVEEGARWLTDSWGGKSVPKTVYQNEAEKTIQRAEQESMAREDVALPADTMREIDVDIDFTEDGKLKRTYSEENLALQEKDPLLARMDKSMHGWLAKEAFACKDEKIYEADKQGHPIQDEEGVRREVPLTVLKDKLEHEVDGLDSYVKEHMRHTQVGELNVTVPIVPQLGGDGPAAAA
jgi:hypothetical protein